MIDWLKYKFLQPTKVQSLFIGYGNAGKVTCSMVLVENIKSDFKTFSSFADLSIEEALQKLDRNLPIILTIDGKGIAHKKVIKKPNSSLFHQALPNAKEADFFVQQYDMDDNSAYISLARKDMVEKLISQFQQRSLSVIGLSLGLFNIEVFANYLDGQPDVVVNDTSLHISNSKIQTIGSAEGFPAKPSFQIAGEIIEAPYLVPFAGAVAFLSNQQYTWFISSFPALMAKEFQYKKLFIAGGWTLLITFFAILLINFSLYSHYNSKLQETQAQVGQGEDVLKKINTLKQELDARKKLSSAGNLSGSSMFSFYSDRLSACVPSQVSLTEMKECPLSGRTKDNAEMVFEKDKIEIKGTTSSSAYINQWIASIEKEKWVKKVDIISYKMDAESNLGLFELHIQINSKNVR